MANLVPIITQEELGSCILITTGSGFALKAFHAPQNIDISLKVLTSQNTTERELKMLLQDVANTRRIQSERLLPSLGIYQSQGLLGVVTEWMCNGSLYSLIHEHHLYPELPFPLLMRILSDVADGLYHLHTLDPPALHCSLKPSNVLLDTQYRAKITDYGLTCWRKQQLRSVLQNCSRSCWDMVYFSPEMFDGGVPSQEGDIYSFGMICWESLSRQKPFEGKKNLLEVVTGICSGLRPETNSEYIQNNLPQGNKLLQLIIRCWHQDPNYRPQTEECAGLLRGILSTFSKEKISSAIYSLIDAKERALNACKGSDTHILQTHMHNLEVIYAQRNSNRLIDKRISQTAQSLSTVLLDSPAGKERANQMPLADITVQNTTQKRACPHTRESALQHSFSTPCTSDPCASRRDGGQCQRDPKVWQQQQLQLSLAPEHSPPHSDLQSTQCEQTLTGPCCKNCCQVLACGRQTILSCMTEGHLNHILDVLRSQRVLSKMDYELITSFPTLSGRTRALLDTCLCLGEGAAQIVVTVLTTSKCSPLARDGYITESPAKLNRRLQ